MQTDVINKLPSREELGREIAANAKRGRQLRSLYKLVLKFERDRLPNRECESTSRDLASA